MFTALAWYYYTKLLRMITHREAKRFSRNLLLMKQSGQAIAKISTVQDMKGQAGASAQVFFPLGGILP